MNVRSDNTKATAVLCFSHLRWNFVYQRPQHLLSRAARNRLVFFIEEPSFTDVGEPDLIMSVTPQGVWTAVPTIPRNYSDDMATEAIRNMVDAIVAELCGIKIILWYYTPLALPISENIIADLCVYDNMDELSLFRGASPRVIDLERELFNRADIVFAGGRSLFEAKRNLHSNIHLFPSSIDARHFGSARTMALPEPTDQATIAHPRFGFFGVIDERMDLALLEQLARRKPDWQFVMIGPVVKIDPNVLPKLPNIFWLGVKKYEDLPHYLSGWDVGIMPFALNESTRFISPTKTPEYLAAGVPVISTPISDVVRPYGELGLAEIASTAEDFITKGTTLLGREVTPWLGRVDAHLATMSWDQTWEEMAYLLENTKSQRTGRREALTEPEAHA